MEFLSKKFTRGLLGGSIILLVTINFFNFLNLIFNVSMARFLTLSDYGIMTTLIYFIIIFAVFSESIQAIITRYVSKEKSKPKVKDISIKALKKASFLSVILYASFLILSIPLSILLKIDYPLFVFVGIIIVISIYIPVTRGVMQGKKRFASLGSNLILEGCIKLIASILLVFLGFKVYGAIMGILIGFFIALIFSLWSIKDILLGKKIKSFTPKIYSYSRPVFVANLSILLLFSVDIILARLFFNPEIAGAYAISATISKIIFMGTQPISKAMFPFSTGAKKEEDSKKAFLGSLKLLTGIIFAFLMITLFFSEIIVNLYSGKLIPESAQILFLLSVAMSIASIANLTVYYKLSSGEIKGFWMLLGLIIIEIILLSIFNSNLVEYSFALITATVTFLWGSIVLLKR